MKDFPYMTENESEFFVMFGQRMAKLRMARGLTQAELAEQIGVNQTAIGSYEIARRRIPLSQVTPLAKALGVSVGELIEKEAPSGKRGPTPKLQQQIQKLSELPKSKQKFVSEMLETVLQSQAAEV